MRFYVLICVAVAVTLATADDDDVIELTDSDFDDRTKDYEIALVEFFAPWCGHCKRLAPEFAKAATQLKDEDPPIALIKVDCTANTEVCKKHGVSGYPTLKIFKGGEASDYEGPRDADGIVNYMKMKSGPSSKELKEVDDVQKFLKKYNLEPVVLGFFNKEGSELQKKFQKAADKLAELFKFGHSYNKDVSKKYNHKDEIVIFRPALLKTKMDDSEVVYKTGDVDTFIGENVHGLCGYRTSSNQAQFKEPLVVAYFDVDYVKNTKGANYWRNRVIKVAKKFPGKNVNFAISAASQFSQEIEEYGATHDTGSKPIVLAKGENKEKFKMGADFSVDNLEKFVGDLLAGKLEPYLKSEPIPENDEEPVKTLVAKNFNEIVNDPTKDVLIEFYAPWCGHCKTLEPKFKELAETLKDEEHIVIAKMDATANDVPHPYNVKGFPTLFFSPIGDKTSPKPYNGGREVKDFIEYLAKESTNGLTGYDKTGKKLKIKKEL